MIGRKSLAENEGLLIPHCNCVHTFFMRFPIDCYFLDKHGVVVKVVRNVPPWRAFVWGGWKARSVLEVRCPHRGTTSGLL